MRRAWICAILLMGPAWCDDREVVTRVFRRPEFLWKSEEKQPPPPVCEMARPFAAKSRGAGLPDRSGGVRSDKEVPNGLIDPAGSSTPSATGTPSDTATPGSSGTPADQSTPGNSGTPTDQSTPGDSGTPAEQSTPGVSGTPADQSTPGVSGTPSDQGRPGESGTPSDQATPGDSGTPSGQGTPADTETPSEDTTPADNGSPSAPSTPDASATPGLPDHPPPPLDYAVEPGLLERFARWWNSLLGRKTGDGLRQTLLLLRDLSVLLLIGLFLRQLLPLLRQLRAWFKSEPPRPLAIEENAPDPEILPEWQQLWRQAAELERQGRAAQGQRMSYLAVLSFLDLAGHIRYRPCETNREYVALLEGPLREPFARLTQRFERCRYGGQPPDFAEFQLACRDILPS